MKVHYNTLINYQIKLQMNPQQTRQHVLNNSGSKYAYKFSKSSRFKTCKLLNDNIYTLNPDKKGRACGFGYGDRSSVGKNNCSPSPNSYTLPSTITTKSKTFGGSRQQVKFQSFLIKALREANAPAPNSYNMPSSLHERKFSLGERLPTEIDLKSKSPVPPPNKYNLDLAGNASTGKYVSSRYKNARKILFFGRETSNDFKSFEVGPGSYNINKDYSLDESRFKNTVKSFGTSDRPAPEDRSKKFVPGPGYYEIFSEFPSISN